MVKKDGAVTVRHMPSHGNIVLDTNLSKTYDIKCRDLGTFIRLYYVVVSSDFWA